MAKKKAVKATKEEDAVLDAVELAGFQPTGDVVAEAADGEIAAAFAAIEPGDEAEEASDKCPLMTDPEWSGYVMKHFEDDELMDGRPCVHGLRRVAELLLGPIVSSKARVVETPKPSNDNRATVEHEVVIKWLRTESGEAVHLRSFTEAADVFPGNTEALFAQHAVGTCSTRSEARALRKALRVKGVAAEEVTSVPPAMAFASPDGRIDEGQINFIDTLCCRCDISVMEFISMGKAKYASIKEVTYNTAVKMTEVLSGFQNNPATIPARIVGYHSDWRNEQ